MREFEGVSGRADGWGFEVSCYDGRFTFDVNTVEHAPEVVLAWLLFTFTNPEDIGEA